MMKRYHHLGKKQSEITVATYAHQAKDQNTVWFVTLAAAFAGFFYFFGENLWHVLAGG